MLSSVLNLCVILLLASMTSGFAPNLRFGLNIGQIMRRQVQDEVGQMQVCTRALLALSSEESEGSSIDPIKAAEFSALRRYKEVFGDLSVPKSFVIPTSNFDWPEETWGLKLGEVVDAIKSTDDYDVYKDELVDIGFKYNAPSAVPEPVQMTDVVPADGEQSVDPGALLQQVISVGLYSYIAYLAIDTIRIVFFPNVGPFLPPKF
jgi:hypothetical protein